VNCEIGSVEILGFLSELVVALLLVMHPFPPPAYVMGYLPIPLAIFR
jgi:hypothetical protein